MTPRNEFVPVGQIVRSSQQLELGFDDQQALVYDMKATDRELSESPFASPSFRAVQLGRVSLLNRFGEKSSQDKLWLHFSEASDGRHNAAIDLLVDSQRTRLQLSQTTDRWDVLAQHNDEPIDYIGTTDVVAFLSARLKNGEELNPLLDLTSLEAMVLVHSLERAIKNSAHLLRERRIYNTSQPLIQGSLPTEENPIDSSFSSSRTVDLSVLENNGRSIHKLTVKSPTPVGRTIIEKEYSYSAETSQTGFYAGMGAIALTSADGYNHHQLATLAERDRYNREPLFTLHQGLTTLREALEGDTRRIAA